MLPFEARALCARLSERPLLAPADLRAALAEYMAEIRAEAQHREFFDLTLAEKIGRALAQLLEALPENPPAHEHAALQVATLYFIEPDDDEHDFLSVLGFEDDARVVNAILEVLGRHGHTIDI